jgi:hypothetical protein
MRYIMALESRQTYQSQDGENIFISAINLTNEEISRWEQFWRELNRDIRLAEEEKSERLTKQSRIQNPDDTLKNEYGIIPPI